MRGYLGVPIILDDGRMFGTFCAVDSEPLEIDPEHVTSMISLAKLLAYAVDVERLAIHDRLTGLHSQALFDDHLQVELARTRRNRTMLAVLLIHVDGFRPENDAPADTGRDTILASVAERLRSSVREGDTLARIGDAEFGLVLPDIHDVDAAARASETLLDSLHDAYMIDGTVFMVSASIGVALSPLHGQDPEWLIVCADAALHAANADGAGGFRIYTEHQHPIADTHHRLWIVPDTSNE